MKLFVLIFTFLMATQSYAGIYQIKNNQLLIDGVTQPQLFGAEVQYFRMRGGYGPNVPRAEVIKLWAAALDHLVEAKMNVISFYIPWDFHEYAAGKFDFDGTVDEDGDGLPDYPSRDVKTFFKMIKERGIKNIMVRPGPYINAEWGFLGFGAIPLWFHLKYPDSHMRNSFGQRTKLYDYHNEDLLRHTRLWFQKLYTEVLQDKIGTGLPISFLQLDNETNFMWQSLYNHDYGTATIKRYQDFLRTKYQSLAELNKRHQRSWGNWQDIKAPTVVRANVAEDQDWYEFADVSVATYLHKVRKIWEDIGVHEPDVLFTLADSYNAPQNGLLPNYQLHNQKGITGLLTVNLYPKTFENDAHPLLNVPFKTDHDVKAAESASELYFGDGQQYAMGPEIQGGWWRGIPVTSDARQQTYLSVIGHGLKALFVYYFNEGDNWQTDWAKNQITPLYNQIRIEFNLQNVADGDLPNSFWGELQARVDNTLLVGFDARYIMHEDSQAVEKLYFDAPLAYGIVPREHFYKLKEIGEKIIAPHGQWLGEARELTDDVCILKDAGQNVPSYLAPIDSVEMNSTWGSGLLGYLLQGGINPKILHWGINSAAELEACKVILRQDSGETSNELATALNRLANDGRSVVNFLADSLAQKMNINNRAQASLVNASGYFTNVKINDKTFAARSAPLFQYAGLEKTNCQSILTYEQSSIGYHCAAGKGHFTQIGSLFYDVYNSGEYGTTQDLGARAEILENILATAGITPTIQFTTPKSDVAFGKLVAFARHVKGQTKRWITVKSALASSTKQTLKVRGLDKNIGYTVQNLMTGEIQFFKGEEIEQTGITVSLPAFGSSVFWIE